MRRGADSRPYCLTPRSPWRSLTLVWCVIALHLVSASDSPSSGSVNDTTPSSRGAFGNAHASSSSSPALLKQRRAAGVHARGAVSLSAPLAAATSPPPPATSRLGLARRNADSHRSDVPKPRQLGESLDKVLNQTGPGGSKSLADQYASKAQKDDESSGSSGTSGTSGTNQTGDAGGGAAGFDEENPPAGGTQQGGSGTDSGATITQPGGTAEAGSPQQGGTAPGNQTTGGGQGSAPGGGSVGGPGSSSGSGSGSGANSSTPIPIPPGPAPSNSTQIPPGTAPSNSTQIPPGTAPSNATQIPGGGSSQSGGQQVGGQSGTHNTTQNPNKPPKQQPGGAGAGGDPNKQPDGTPLIPGGNTSTNTGGTGNATSGAANAGGTSLNTNSGGGSGSGSNTWAIVGGVVGGIVLLASAIFIVYRLTQRRFSSLEDEGVEIRWPELNPDGQEVSANTSTLYPLGTTRTGGAGVEMESDKSEWGDDTDYATHERKALSSIPGREAYLARGPTLHARQMSYGALAMQSRSEVGMSPDGYFDSSSDGLRRNPSSQGSYPPSPPNMMAYGGGGGVPPPPVPGMPPHQYGGAIYPGPGQPLPGSHSPTLPGGPAHMPPFQFGSSYPSLEGSTKPYSTEQATASQHRAQQPSSDSIDNYYPEFEPRADTPQHFAVTNPDRASSEVGAGNMDPQQLRHQLSVKTES